MPNTEVTPPTATAPIDRLTLTVGSARDGAAPNCPCWPPAGCYFTFADDVSPADATGPLTWICFADDVDASPSWGTYAPSPFCFADEM